ncbi:MAG: flavin reductase family protein [bacterium]|nr:flavin reductase family protein [Acidimicrobiia bacterium]MCY4649801.1 flavin reductase family protein [bacterium]
MKSEGPSSTSAEIDSLTFRKACGQFMTGVTIVTTIDQKTGPAGLAANSFTSVSLDPPLVLISVDRGANSLRALESSGRYAVHILGAHQEDLCRRFAKSDLSGTEKLEGVSWTPGMGGVPLLDDYLVRFECRVVNAVPGGDHVIYLAEVERLDFEETEAAALGFFRGAYLRSPG